MPTYVDEKRCRIEQFAEYLRLMGLRRHKIVKTTCFVIFDESPPVNAESPKLNESAAIKIDCLAGSGLESGVTGRLRHRRPMNRPSHFVQFAFHRDCFFMDLPNTTIYPQEAEHILHCRQGFYWARYRRDLRWVRNNWKLMVEFNPLQKIYLYRDEESAAEDMAFILFQIWHFPVDSPLYVTAATFPTKHRSKRG